MSEKNLKEITYSSEYVGELENKIEYLEEENALIKHRYFISECEIRHLAMYEEALKMAITNGIVIGGYDFWKEAAERYGLQQLYNECIHRNAPNIHKGVVEFYLSLIAKAEVQNSEVIDGD